MTAKLPVFFSGGSRTQRLHLLRVVRAAKDDPVAYAPDPDDHGFLAGSGDAPHGRGPVFGAVRGAEICVRLVRDLVNGNAALYGRVEGDGAELLTVLHRGEGRAAAAHGAFLLSASSADDDVWLRAASEESWARHRDEALGGAEGSDGRRDRLRRAVDDEREELRRLARGAMRRAAVQEARDGLLERYKREAIDALRREAEAKADANHVVTAPERQRLAAAHVRENLPARLWAILRERRSEYERAGATTEDEPAPTGTRFGDEESAVLTLFLRNREGASGLLDELIPSADQIARVREALAPFERAAASTHPPWGAAPATPPERSAEDEHEARVMEALRAFFPWWVERRAKLRLAREAREGWWASAAPSSPAAEPKVATVHVHAGSDRALGPELAQFSVAIYDLQRVPVAVHQTWVASVRANVPATYLTDPVLADAMPEVPLDEPPGMDEDALRQFRAVIERAREARRPDARPRPREASAPLTDAEVPAPWFNLPGERGLARAFELTNAAYAPAGLRFVPPACLLVERFNDDLYALDGPALLRATDRVPVDHVSPASGDLSWFANQACMMAVLANDVSDALNLHVLGTFDEVGNDVRYRFLGLAITGHIADAAPPQGAAAVRVFDTGPLDWRAQLTARGVTEAHVYPDPEGRVRSAPLEFAARPESPLADAGEATADLPGLDVGAFICAYARGTESMVLGTRVAARTLAHEFGHVLGAIHYANAEGERAHRNLWGHRSLMFPEVDFDPRARANDLHPASPARGDVGYGFSDFSGSPKPLPMTGWMIAQKRHANPENKFAPAAADTHADEGADGPVTALGLVDDQRHVRVLRAAALRGDWRPRRATGGSG